MDKEIVRFEYTHREYCVCGKALENVSPVVEKNTPWGPISFFRCRFCKSFPLAPLISTDSLMAWYETTYYQGDENNMGTIYGNYSGDETARIKDSKK